VGAMGYTGRIGAHERHTARRRDMSILGLGVVEHISVGEKGSM